MRGLIKASAIYNNHQAWMDFKRLADFAIENGAKDEVAKCIPPMKAGHRVVDRHIRKLRHALIVKGVLQEVKPDANQ